MEKHLEKIREEYKNYILDETMTTGEDLNKYTKLAINLHQALTQILFYQFSDNCGELSSRVTEGFYWDMERVFEAIEGKASLELYKLGFFLIKKYDANMDYIRKTGLDMPAKKGKGMPINGEDSLFTEVFFAEKFKEITGRDLVEENRERIYGKK